MCHIANFVKFIEKTCNAVKSIENKSTTYKIFTWARAQVCHVHPTPMLGGLAVVRRTSKIYFAHERTNIFQIFVLPQMFATLSIADIQ